MEYKIKQSFSVTGANDGYIVTIIYWGKPKEAKFHSIDAALNFIKESERLFVDVR
jgi:hypothetical protein